MSPELSVDVAWNNTSTVMVSVSGRLEGVDRYIIKARDAAGNPGIGGLKNRRWTPDTNTLWPETQVQGLFSWEFGPTSQNIQIMVYERGKVWQGNRLLPPIAI